MKLGSNDISSVKIGSTDVSKVYIGSTEVWSASSLLLDDYSGAAAAYSLRLLSSTYTGDAIEVRNSSGTHLDIGFVDGELDTATLLTHCGAGDGTVSKWYDQSGNGNDATQTTVANQPQIVSSGSVITLNSKPAIQAASTLKGFDVAQFTWSAGYISTVFNRTGRIGTFDSLWIFDGGEPYNQLYSTGSDWLYYSKGVYTTTIPLSTSQKLITMSDNGTSTLFYDNATLNSTFSISKNVTNLTLRLMYSGSRAWLGNMQEFIFWDSDESSNRTGIETNINDFYSIYYVATNSEYQDVLDYADSQGYQRPSYAQQALQDALVGDLKDAGVWSNLDLFYVFATDGDSDFASINWKDPNNYEITEVNSPTFTSNQGFEGDGNSSYLNTNFVASTDSVKYTDADASFGIYANQAPSASNAFLTATRSGSDVNANYLRVSLSSINSNNTGNRDNFVTFYNFMQVQLISGTQYLYGNGNEITSKTFVGTPSVPTTSIYILAFNNNGTAQSFADSTIRSFYAGSSLLSESSDLNTALTTYYNAL